MRSKDKSLGSPARVSTLSEFTTVVAVHVDAGLYLG